MAEEKQETEAEKPAEEMPAEKAEAKAEKKPAEKSGKVNYVYAALLLHSAGKPVSEDSLKKVVEATGEKSDSAQVKAVVSSLEGVDIDEAISQAALAAAPAASAPSAPAAEEKKEEKEDEGKKAEEAAAGLSSLFG